MKDQNIPPEKIRFHCDSCKREWVEERPHDHYIRSGNGTNYYIKQGNEDKHIPIHCPKCHDQNKIRLIPPPMRPSTDNHHSQKAMNNWATNPITKEEMLGDRL